jgi:hypothetical protein
MKKLFLVFAFLALGLTGCASGQSSSSDASDIDASDIDADIQSIYNGVAKFNTNSQRVNKTINMYREVTEMEGLILEEIDVATNVLLRHTEIIGDKLPKKDSIEGPTKATLLHLANAYKSWVYYLKLNNNIAETCTKRPIDWQECILENRPVAIENEYRSRLSLDLYLSRSEEWRKSFGR